MARKRKQRRQEEQTDESWLLPYADMLTLLLALFIILFASSTIDVGKYEQMMSALNNSFSGGEGVLDHAALIPETNEVDETAGETVEENEQKEAQAQEREDLRKLKEQIDQYIVNNALESQVETNLSSDGLLLTILDNALFQSGSSEVRSDALSIAEEISDLLIQSESRKIVVAGHTDNIPISNAQFTSNWELSSHRALNFMKILLDNGKLDPRNLSATGYGEYHPVDTNETAEGRERNRRVEVLIMPKLELN